MEENNITPNVTPEEEKVEAPEVEEPAKEPAQEVEKVEAEPAKEANEPALEEQPKKKKRKFEMPKIFKNKVFVYGVIAALTLFGAFLLFMIDDYNSIRNLIGIKPESIAWLRNIFKLDVNILTWVIFAIISVTAFLTAFALSFIRPIKDKVNAQRRLKAGKELSKKGTIIYYVIFFGIMTILIVIIVIAIIMMLKAVGGGASLGEQFKSLTDIEQFFKLLVTFLKSSALLLVSVFSIPVLVVLFVVLFKLVILLFGGIAGGVAKNVMQSEGFQETYAAAQAATNRINEMANQLPKTISVVAEPSGGFAGAGVGGGAGGGSAANAFGLNTDGTIFPALEAIDLKYVPAEEEKPEGEEAPEQEAEVVEEKPAEEKGKKAKAKETEVVEEKPEEAKKAPAKKREDFSRFIDEFQSYLAKHEKLYFSKKVLRTFVAGMSASRLLLLEGLSGTGKSSLPRKLQEFIGGKATFLPVQATWRDRTDIIGYYSDLTGYYKETELLKSIYESSYRPTEINLIVLDEMNISRAEYYFADFLSIYEYPSEDWKVQLMQVSADTKLPKLINGGALQIPTNIWFVGTINVDDSTFTVTDKVYDRAIVINFNTINDEFEAQFNKELEPVTYEEIVTFFDNCQNDKKLLLTKEDKKVLYDLVHFLDDTFDIKVGNRIFNQIELFVPVFVGLGGTKYEALDMMISAKIFRKLDNVFIMEMGDSLIRLQRFINQNFKKGNLPLCEAKLNAMLKKYQ